MYPLWVSGTAEQNRLNVSFPNPILINFNYSSLCYFAPQKYLPWILFYAFEEEKLRGMKGHRRRGNMEDLLHAVWAHLHYCSTFLACPARRTDNIIHIFLLTEDTTSTLIFSSRMFKFPAVDPLTKFWLTWMSCPCFSWIHHGYGTVWQFSVGKGQRQGKRKVTNVLGITRLYRIHETSWD